MLSENSSKTLLCLKCGTINRMPSEVCSKCGAPLIKGRKLPPRISKRYNLLKELVQKYQREELTAQEFKDALDKMKGQITRVLNEHMERAIPPDLEQEAKDELMLGRAGIARYLSALESLMYYANNNNLEALEEGLQYAEEATDMLNRAMVLNWESFRAFQESIEEHLLQNSL